ncbi:MAG: YcxB family protein [Verrucomicrobiota bacterium JB024]|nr:YcxB family protein [Verrucomicrobiota bacterium JB024]
MIEIEYVYDKAYALRTGWAITKRQGRILIPAYCIVLFLATVGVILLTVDNIRAGARFDFIALGIVVWLWSVPFWVRWRMLSRFKKTPLAGKAAKWAIDETSLRQWIGASEGTLNWSDIYQCVEIRRGFLIYTQPSMAALLPAEAFASEADKEKLRGFARAAGKFKK